MKEESPIQMLKDADTLSESGAINTILERCRKGTGLNDYELLAAYIFWTKLITSLRALEPDFNLALNVAYQKRECLESYIRERWPSDAATILQYK